VEEFMLLQVLTDDHELNEVVCAIGAAVEHVKGHLMMVTARDGARHTWNFRHVIHYRMTENPAKPMEGN